MIHIDIKILRRVKLSDFIFTKKHYKYGELSQFLQNIYQDKIITEEFHGKWGSLAVSQNLYNGFLPYENSKHIFIVIGGPLLLFRNNNFINKELSNIGTKSIYEKWKTGEIVWDEDLSGPFAILLINKNTSEINLITDLMSFIPVYNFRNKQDFSISTHVDLLAKINNEITNIDRVSIADFILNGTVIFPYTMYKKIFQMEPAYCYKITEDIEQDNSFYYWKPLEEKSNKHLNEYAKEVIEELKKYVNIITNNTKKIAQFVSGGEDSRVILSLLESKEPDAFVFLDSMNREGHIAKQAAEAYNANFNFVDRSKYFYLDILSESSDIVGSNSQYTHAHSLKFHKTCGLNNYDAVFGGFLSDALLKGLSIKKKKSPYKFPLVPEIKDNEASLLEINSDMTIFHNDTLEKLFERKKNHYEYVKNVRPNSAMEWVYLWPITMSKYLPNFHINRRLFKSYEPFMSNGIVKISAEIPQKWKLNRKLFNKSVKNELKKTKWLVHSDGRYPYFPWYTNSFFQFNFRMLNKLQSIFGKKKNNEGPWADWSSIMKSDKWKKVIEYYSKDYPELNSIFKKNKVIKLLESEILNNTQKLNLLQILYYLDKKYN